MLNLTPFLRLYARWRTAQLASHNPAEVQSDQLLALLQKAQTTHFGQAHGFSSIKSVEEYQKRVPLRTYEQFWEEYWKNPFPRFQGSTWPTKVEFIPVSSGTSSGTTKWIPCSPEMIRSNTKAGLDLLVHHLNNRPQSQLFGGKNFILGGSTDLVERSPGIYSGDLSGIAVKTLPWWAKMRYYPPPEIALLKDWEEKIQVLAEGSLKEDIRNLSGVPSWLLILFERLAKLRPSASGRLVDYYPNLEMLVHGGVNFAPYIERFKTLLEGSHAELREVYPASEGFIAVADRGYGDGLRMNLDHGIFYEFIPVDELGTTNPTRHWIENVVPEVNYAIALTTCAGLWSYLIGDTVRFVDVKTPRLLITGRTSYFMSAFGEHLIAEEIDDGVSFAAKENGLTVTDYAMGALYPEKEGTLGGHIYVIECVGGTPSTDTQESFLSKLDSRLCKRNEDYEAHRNQGFGMNAPKAKFVPPGTFAAWMKSRGKLGGQHKVPRIINKEELLSNLLSFVRSSGA